MPPNSDPGPTAPERTPPDDTTPPVTAEDLRKPFDGVTDDTGKSATAEDLRERLIACLESEPLFGTGEIVDAVIAELSGDPGDLPARMRKAAREAFADRVDAEGSLSISTHRNPWVALDDALAAAMSVRWEDTAQQAAEVERLRTDFATAVQRAGQAHADAERRIADVMDRTEAEVERLRAELAGHKAAFDRAWEVHTEICSEAENEQLRAERDVLKAAVLDIDAHATPYGDIPDEPGYVGTYLVTAGALHRALGKIGHTAPKCQAEAALDQLRAYARWCKDRAVEPDERDIIALADGTCGEDYVALMAADAPDSPAPARTPVTAATEAHRGAGEGSQ